MVDVANSFVKDLEKAKFVQDSNLDVAVNTVIAGGELRLVGMNEAIKITNFTITTTRVAVPAAPLINRNSMIIQNKGNKSVFIGDVTVENAGASQGWEIDAGSFFSIDITDSVILYAISDGTSDIKVMEMA